MLIRISGGTDGIRQYLEDGQKQGRHFSRDELDERVILAGDLETTDAIIQSLENDGEKYLHLTIAFKEDAVDTAVLNEIVKDFEGFAFSAYSVDEYSFYAEAHLPRIKSYTNEQNGEFVERKPHIHIVIPKANLLSGQHMNPFGVVDQNERFIDAFQEHVNNKYGLASPKDNRRIEFTGSSEMISRYKGDFFDGQSKDIKSSILASMVERRIESYDGFKALLAELGNVSVRNYNRSNEYLNLKTSAAARGVNLKDYVFSREFVELPHDEKQKRLAQDVHQRYKSIGDSRRQPERINTALAEWHSARAREIKYLNSGNRKAWSQYRSADAATREKILSDREAKFYAKHRQEAKYELGNERQRRVDAGRLGRGYGLKRSFEHDRPNSHHRQFDVGQGAKGTASQSVNRVRSLSSLSLDGLGQRREVLLPGHAPGELEHSRTDGAGELRRAGSGDRQRGGLSIGGSGRASDSVIGQLSRDRREHDEARTASDAVSMSEVKLKLDARRLLAELSQSHGLIAEKYEVTKAQDGSDRIKCGSRNLNVTDFVTKEMRLPWRKAEELLTGTYSRQLGREPEATKKVHAGRQLWADFQAHRTTDGAKHRAKAWEDQRASEKERQEVIKRQFYAARSQIQSDRKQSSAHRKAALSVARMERIEREADLRKQVLAERLQLRKDQRTPAREQFRDYLASRSQEGDEVALAELRRMKPHAEAFESRHEARITAGDRGDGESRAPLHRASAISYSVDRHGDVTYRRDGREVLRDAGRAVQMLREDDLTIETGLRLAQQKFGSKLALSGPQAFQERAVRVAADAGLKIEFSDQRLNQLVQDRRAELEAMKTRDAEARRLAQDFAKQREKKSAAVPSAKVNESRNEAPALRAQIADGKQPNTEQSRYTGEVVAVDETAVYQQHGRDTIKHDRTQFSELPKPGEQIQVVYQQGKANVKNLGSEQDRDRDSGPSMDR